MKNITLGKYIPLDSFIHSLDPRTKLKAMFMFLVIIFVPAGFYGYGIVAVVLFAAVYAAKLKAGYIWKSFKPMLFMLFFLGILNIFTIKTGTLLLQLGKFTVYSGAISQTCYIVVRLLLMIIVTTLLTATTKPLDLTLGLEDIMAPLQNVKFPSHEVAMMISLALRFIPQLLEEANRILKAQASRGVDMENGSFKDKVQAILSLIVPLFVSCFQKADDLADAMEARGYVVGAPRVRYKQLSYSSRDYFVRVFMWVLLALTIAVAVWL